MTEVTQILQKRLRGNEQNREILLLCLSLSVVFAALHGRGEEGNEGFMLQILVIHASLCQKRVVLPDGNRETIREQIQI